MEQKYKPKIIKLKLLAIPLFPLHFIKDQTIDSSVHSLHNSYKIWDTTQLSLDGLVVHMYLKYICCFQSERRMIGEQIFFFILYIHLYDILDRFYYHRIFNFYFLLNFLLLCINEVCKNLLFLDLFFNCFWITGCHCLYKNNVLLSLLTKKER